MDVLTFKSKISTGLALPVEYAVRGEGSPVADGVDPSPEDEKRDPTRQNRFFFETIAMQCAQPIPDRYVQFTIGALQMMADGYATGKPLLIQHEKDFMLPIGKTTAAKVVDQQLIVQAYVHRGWHTPFGGTDQVIQGVNDGAVDSVSISIQVRQTRCTICQQTNPCGHLPGELYPITENPNVQRQVAIRDIEIAEVLELSIVTIPAEPEALIIDRDIIETSFSMKGDIYMATQEELITQNKTLTAQVQAQEAKMESNASLLESKEAEVGALTDRAESLQASLTTISERKDALTTENADLKSRLAKTEKEKGELQEQVDNFSDTQSQLDEILGRERTKALDLYKGAFPDAEEAIIKDKESMLSKVTSVTQLDEFAAAWKALRDANLPAGRQTVDTDGKQKEDAKSKKSIDPTQLPGYAPGY